MVKVEWFKTIIGASPYIFHFLYLAILSYFEHRIVAKRWIERDYIQTNHSILLSQNTKRVFRIKKNRIPNYSYVMLILSILVPVLSLVLAIVTVWTVLSIDEILLWCEMALIIIPDIVISIWRKKILKSIKAD